MLEPVIPLIHMYFTDPSGGDRTPLLTIKPDYRFTKQIRGLSPQARKKRLSNRKVHLLWCLSLLDFCRILSNEFTKFIGAVGTSARFITTDSSGFFCSKESISIFSFSISATKDSPKGLANPSEVYPPD